MKLFKTQRFAHVAGRHPLTSLMGLFVVWKALLLLIALLSPGPGYDTSTTLRNLNQLPRADRSTIPRPASGRLPRNLARWDALYFVSTADRGYFYEQEWAFGAGFSSLLHQINKTFSAAVLPGDSIVWSGVIIAHTSHLISAFILHRLCSLIFQKPTQTKYAFVVAALHIIAPAGIFLSAPYSESSFSLLNFAGYWLYVFGSRRRSAVCDLSLVLAGIFFGLASTFRGNGIFSGIIFAYDLVMALPFSHVGGVRHCAALLLGALCTALGFATPQVVAYRQYCVGKASPGRPWCRNIPPSVYTFVQQHYWNNGFLKYWTISNLPLFIIALPMLTLLLTSASLPLQSAWLDFRNGPGKNDRNKSSILFDPSRTKDFTRLAMPQLILALLAVTNSHVQIINRISSGYVLPYFFIADLFIQKDLFSGSIDSLKISKVVVRGMCMYSLIQGGLFANFLPPA